ncbi:serine threonine kinase [Trichoderma cornu-damae]|uniref:Serine threonine kinase n=1 Tax=Trichoderma cornu-damae TaxID=654480 RepID=A0A9P8QJQ8_9HYPO|nr:serine threonine kinase [Trichoderma cornu-damae]
MPPPDGRPCTSPSPLRPQAQPQAQLRAQPQPQPQPPAKHSFLRKLLTRSASSRSSQSSASSASADPEPSPGLVKRMSKRVVPGLPRSQTFKRQLSESRSHLAPVEPSAEERRAASVDRRSHCQHSIRPGGRASRAHVDPRSSAPSFFGEPLRSASPTYAQSLPVDLADLDGDRDGAEDGADDGDEDRGDDTDADDADDADDECTAHDAASVADSRSLTASQYEAMIHEELEKEWILNLSMHFRDRSKREKFFVTYREHEHTWRRVTISLDYRDAPDNSLEWELNHTKYQRDKSAKIYEAIRESLPDIQFYDTVTNLKLETTDGRLHVHVVEDGNIRHLGCKRVKERDIVFDSHMSGFVYKVCVQGNVLIKKEIPSPDTVEEFLYEVNALNGLRFSRHVIDFYGVVVDDGDEHVKGLLISFAGQGALIDIIFENCKENDVGLPWATREKWARQIVQGLADVHESGFVQGDFTLSNIVIDDAGDAKIIDINRRGCPVGWEPPEATALIESNQRLSMYIGVKSDLYQLGMVLWGLAMLEDEPETQGRPLMLGPEINVPDWYRQMTEICLSDDPRMRPQASSLLHMFPRAAPGGDATSDALRSDHYDVDSRPATAAMETEPDNDWAYSGTTYVHGGPLPYDQYYSARGRSPPSPLPSDLGGADSSYKSGWAANRNIAPSYSDSGDSCAMPDSDYDVRRQPTPTPSAERFLNISDRRSRPLGLLNSLARESTEYFTAVDDQADRADRAPGGLRVPLAPESSWGGSAVNVVADEVDEVDEADETAVPELSEADGQAGGAVNAIPAVIVTESPANAAATRTSTSTKTKTTTRTTTTTTREEEEEEEEERRGRSKNECEEDAGRQDSAVDVRFDAREADNRDARRDESAARSSPRLKLSKNAANIKVKRLRRAARAEHGSSPSPRAASHQRDAAVAAAAAAAAADRPVSTVAGGTGSKLNDDGAALRVTTPETESEPDYVASRSPGFKSPDPRQSYNASDAQRAGQLLNGGDAGDRWIQPSDETLGQTEPLGGFMYPRHGSIPVSLTGIGAAHLGRLDRELLPDKGLIEDEFQLMARPEATPLMITTDAQT